MSILIFSKLRLIQYSSNWFSRQISARFSSQNCSSTSTNASKPPRLILQDIRVLDVSRILAGPYATQQLSDLGAEVIKVESFEGDETRKWGPPFANAEDSSYFLCANRNKKSICLNLKTKEGQQVLYDLVKRSDVFTENYSQGVTQKLHIDYDTLQKINPRLIYASISGYGESGPLALSPAFDLIMQARSGFMHVTGQPGGPPSKLGFAISDVLTGLNLSNGILAALYNRAMTGNGIHVKTSLQEASVSSLVNVASQYLNGGLEGKRLGNMHASIVPYGVYKAKNDEYIVVGAVTDEQFKRFCKVINRSSISEEPRFLTNKMRVANREELDRIITEAIKHTAAEELDALLQENKIPGGRILNISQVFNDSQVKHLNMAQHVESDRYPNLQLVRGGVSFSEDVLAEMSEPPALNQHANMILKDVLGYDDGKIQSLKDKKAIK